MREKLMTLAALASMAAVVGCGNIEGPQDNDDDIVSAPAPAPLSCTYPTANAGTAQGNVVPKLAWENALRPNGKTLETLRTQEFIDCDGYQGSNALVFLTHTPG